MYRWRILRTRPLPPPPTHTARGGRAMREGHWNECALKLMYIKLPMYMFFYMAIPLLNLLGPHGTSFAHCHYRAQKKVSHHLKVLSSEIDPAEIRLIR